MSKWISVKERLPEVAQENRYYGINGYNRAPFAPAIFFAGGFGSGVIAGRYFPPFGKRRQGVWFSLQGEKYTIGMPSPVTHWMPLPDPPVIGTEEE